MCTLLILFRPKHQWPLIIAGNRDEMLDRKWKKPAYHWKEFPSVIAGKDILAGGTWLGINKTGMVATVLNRSNSLGPSNNKISRGVLPLLILKHKDIKSAKSELKSLKLENWKSFNLFFGDSKSAYWAKHNNNTNSIQIKKIPPGKHILDSHDLDSFKSPRIKLNFKNFMNSKDPDPENSDWHSWKKILSSKKHYKNNPLSAVNITKTKDQNYGTSSSSIIAVCSSNTQNKIKNNLFLFNSGTPEKNNFSFIDT